MVLAVNAGGASSQIMLRLNARSSVAASALEISQGDFETDQHNGAGISIVGRATF